MYSQKIFEQTLEDSKGQGSLAPCSPWGRNLATEQQHKKINEWLKGWTMETNIRHIASRADINGLV